VLKGDYQILERSFITAFVRNKVPGVVNDPPISCFAMNDIVIKSQDSGRTLSFGITIDKQPVAHYRADGLILATPTGSTAYNLAAGGPIIYPTLKAVTITPICPHTLTFRPVVVPASVEIAITAGPSQLYIDGFDYGTIHQTDELICTGSERSISLIQPRHMPYFDVLRLKLGWGQ